MSVIPLTLTISLCLVFTFVVFFLRETSRRHYSDAQRDALMPLADEIPLPAKASALVAAPVTPAARPIPPRTRNAQ